MSFWSLKLSHIKWMGSSKFRVWRYMLHVNLLVFFYSFHAKKQHACTKQGQGKTKETKKDPSKNTFSNYQFFFLLILGEPERPAGRCNLRRIQPVPREPNRGRVLRSTLWNLAQPTKPGQGQVGVILSPKPTEPTLNLPSLYGGSKGLS